MDRDLNDEQGGSVLDSLHGFTSLTHVKFPISLFFGATDSGVPTVPEFTILLPPH